MTIGKGMNVSDFDEQLKAKEEAAEKMWAEREANGTAQRGLVTIRSPITAAYGRNITGAYRKPIHSFALAIPNKKQQREFKKLYPDAEFDQHGRRVIRSHQERKRIIKREGLVDYDNYNPQLDETCR